MLTERHKALILDSIIQEHGHIAVYLAKDERPCGCDLEVGYVCEYCAEEAIIARIAAVYQLYNEPDWGARLDPRRITEWM